MSDLNPSFQAPPEPTPSPATEAPKPTPPNPQPQEPAAASPEAATPPWGDEANFNADMAWSLIKGLRADKDRLTRRELTEDQQQKLAEYDRLVEASKTDLERAQEAATKNEQRAQALLDRAVKAEIKASAAEGFADPEDAAAFLDLKKYATKDGDIDSESIKADLADLLARKPHLGKQPTSRVPAPNPAQGSSGAGAPPKQTPEEQIAELEKNGDIKAANRIRAQMLMDYRAANGG